MISRESTEYNLHIKLCCKLNSSFPIVEQRYNELLNTEVKKKKTLARKTIKGLVFPTNVQHWNLLLSYNFWNGSFPQVVILIWQRECTICGKQMLYLSMELFISLLYVCIHILLVEAFQTSTDFFFLCKSIRVVKTMNIVDLHELYWCL